MMVATHDQARQGVSRCRFVAFWPSCPNSLPSEPSQSDKRKFMMQHYNAHALDCVATVTATARAAQAVSGEVRGCTMVVCDRSACSVGETSQ